MLRRLRAMVLAVKEVVNRRSTSIEASEMDMKWISFSHEGGSKEKKPSIRGGWEDSEDWP
jgi:hypothetical protein